MGTFLLATKLRMPPQPQHVVHRVRLIDALERAIPHYKLVLIAAPAGYGKTTLLSQWAQASRFSVAWLSLSEEDNDTERFLRYLLMAWEEIQPGVMESPFGLLLGGSMPDSKAILAAFINVANQVPDHIVFVLDDYHLIEDPSIHHAMTFLLDHLPPTLHFVLAGRAEPPLPLARYRARHELSEFGAEDLQFLQEETADFLNWTMGLELPHDEIIRLQTQLEGWIAGLQLVALTLQRRLTGADKLLVSGRHRFIADYLGEDVLAPLPDTMRRFLLQTSILNRLSGALCDAVTEAEGSQEMLERLGRENLFLVPLDDSREWFRFHRLFADFLQEELKRRYPDEVTTVHRRAARWYPTCTTLPNGRALIVSGYAAHAHFQMNEDMEVFDSTSNTILSRRHFLSGVDLYPFVRVLPGGTLFVHQRDVTYLFGLDPTTREPLIPPLAPVYRNTTWETRTYNGQGACVLLPLDPDKPNRVQLLVVGGGGAPLGKLTSTTPASLTAEVFDFDPSTGSLSGQSGWRVTKTPPPHVNPNPTPAARQTVLATRRLMSDAVLLPDGTVAIVGGVERGMADNADGTAVMEVESFDPETETFTTMVSMTVPRFYHATALLLQDGSVLMAGSTGPIWSYKSHGGNANEFRLEMYYPPYLFRGPAPRVQLASANVGYGQQFAVGITSGDGNEVARVALLRAGSSTHTNNMDQRYVGLHVALCTANEVRVDAPLDGTVAPPGPYWLFAIKVPRGIPDSTATRIPSRGVLVMVGP